MKKMLAITITASCIGGCATMSGSYRVTAVNEKGASIPVVMNVRGSNIYMVRNAICSAHPGATVSIVDTTTGDELRSESPYKCKHD
jgi:hypothetical protein